MSLLKEAIGSKKPYPHWFILLLPPRFPESSRQERFVKARLQLDVLALTHVSYRLCLTDIKDALSGCVSQQALTTQLYPGYPPAEQCHSITASWAGEATGTAGSGIHLGFLRTTHTSALRLSSSTWLNYLQAEHPTGRDLNEEGCSALALVYTPHLRKHHCCTCLRDGCMGQSRGLPEAGATNLLQRCCDDTSQEITGGFSPERRTEEKLFQA